MVTELVKTIVSPLLDDPTVVTYEEKVNEKAHSTTVIIRAPKSVIPHLIGKRGSIVEAMRTVLDVCSGTYKTRVRLFIKDLDESKEDNE